MGAMASFRYYFIPSGVRGVSGDQVKYFLVFAQIASSVPDVCAGHGTELAG